MTPRILIQIKGGTIIHISSTSELLINIFDHDLAAIGENPLDNYGNPFDKYGPDEFITDEHIEERLTQLINQ